MLIKFLGLILRGVQAYHFGEKGFRAKSWRGRPGHVPKLGHKPKSELKEKELSYCDHSIFFKNENLKKELKNDQAFFGF